MARVVSVRGLSLLWAALVTFSSGLVTAALADAVPAQYQGAWSRDCASQVETRVTLGPEAVTVTINGKRQVYNGVFADRTWYGGARATGDMVWFPTSKTLGAELEFVIAAATGKDRFLVLEEGHPDFGDRERAIFGQKLRPCGAQTGSTGAQTDTQDGATFKAGSAPSRGRRLDVPVIEQGGDGQAANCSSSIVAGLKPGGDGFLSVRTGPGTQFRKIDELHNGDVVLVYDGRGDWAAVAYKVERADCASTTTREVLHKNTGWVHTKWLRDLAG